MCMCVNESGLCANGGVAFFPPATGGREAETVGEGEGEKDQRQSNNWRPK